VTFWQRPEDFVLAQQQTQQRLAAAGWSRTEHDYVEPVDAGPDKVHFRMQFTRYREDGSVIGSYRSLYISALCSMSDGESRVARVGRSRQPMTEYDYVSLRRCADCAAGHRRLCRRRRHCLPKHQYPGSQSKAEPASGAASRFCPGHEGELCIEPGRGRQGSHLYRGCRRYAPTKMSPATKCHPYTMSPATKSHLLDDAGVVRG
jgi:hypothetical protein